MRSVYHQNVNTRVRVRVIHVFSVPVPCECVHDGVYMYESSNLTYMYLLLFYDSKPMSSIKKIKIHRSRFGNVDT